MEDALKTAAAVVLLVLNALLPSQISAADEVVGTTFPSELEGVWDAHPWPCDAAAQSDSDTRLLIEGGRRRNYEDDDILLSVDRIATQPDAWRILSVSSLDPGSSRKEARIYVLAGDRLTVADEGRTEVYIRCR